MANRRKMSAADRAKQFAPFAALRGFEEALRKQERVGVDKVDLSEDAAEELNRRLCAVEKGMLVSAVYYADGEYLRRTGIVERIDPVFRTLRIVDCAISFDDLLQLDIPEAPNAHT